VSTTLSRSPFSPPPPPGAGQRARWVDLHGSAAPLAIGRAGVAFAGVTLVVARDTASAERWVRELEFYTPELPVVRFPDWETLAYDAFSPHQDLVSERLAALRALRHRAAHGAHPLALVVSAQTLTQRLAPVGYLDAHAIDLASGQTFDLHAMRQRLEQAGYQTVETVSMHGEFAVRGALMDIFPMGAALPIRIDLFDNDIETIRIFDPETQRTRERTDHIRLLPAREHPFDEAAIARFRDRWHNTFNVDVRRCSVYQDVSHGIPPGGIEYYLPFFFDRLATLFDYLPPGTLVIEEDGSADEAEHHWDEVHRRYANLAHDVERPILPPAQLYLAPGELRESLNRHGRIQVGTEGRHALHFGTRRLPPVAANPHARQPGEPLLRFLREHGGRTLFVADTAGRREVFAEFLARAGVRPADVSGFDAFVASDAALGITIAPVARGLWLPGLAVVTESEVFGHEVAERRPLTSRAVDPEQVIRNLTELRTGDPVVHIEHGIGRYLGLTTLEIEGEPCEFLAIAYADDARLYVPVTSLHLISRYSGADAEHAPLHRLGSDQWEKARRRAAEKAHDAAAELLSLYARREVGSRFRFAAPGEEYRRFADQFPFEVTPDQQRAIDEVIDDLCSERATDRLICGDVGFGKTEVAMRAAFLAVQSGKQVAVLVPTTLLAEQHYESFRDRFADWPVRIEALSRLRSDSEAAAILGEVAGGRVDILIGTHKLLGPVLRFKDLGLVIIDEEHRFGVRQKERLRALRAEVDVLALTATPIPRTLNMALTGIRELSVIATPPARRLSIKTFVMERRRGIIQEAITRELMRGGQVFYVHNEVRTIEAVAREISEWVPEARIGVGHGQMPKRRLEQVMNDFYHRRLNLLVCSTIIETGIDVANANTIVIDRADKLGLAQLHQLRGRVGRSHRQAYAYLLTPPPRAMTPDAVKRLEAIEAAGELGIGFTLATHDMEIRGAGELLGEEQHGQIESVGFNLYMELLERAVRAIREGRAPDLDKPLESFSREVNLHAGTRIPDTYLPDVHARLIVYKRIASAADGRELDDLMAEVIDRFGPLPEALRRLFEVTGVKLEMQPLGILKLDLGARGGRIEFSPETTVDPLTVVKLVQSDPRAYRLDGATLLRINRPLEDYAARLDFARDLLAGLGARRPAPRAALA
jgi:transcription-repair coupling factor (superfamily II helicase)